MIKLDEVVPVTVVEVVLYFNKKLFILKSHSTYRRRIK